MHFAEEQNDRKIKNEIVYAIASTVADFKLDNSTVVSVDKLNKRSFTVKVVTDLRLIDIDDRFLDKINFRISKICERSLVSILTQFFDNQSGYHNITRREYVQS